MSQSLYLNNGNIFNVVDIARSRINAEVSGNGLGYNLAAGEISASYINGMEYITDSMQPHYVLDPPYGLLYSLSGENTKARHKEVLQQILDNGAFVWGDAYNGGLYVYRSHSINTYGIALFCGYGVRVDNPDRDIFYFKDFATAQNLTADQMKWITIFHNVTDDNYAIYYGGDYSDGDGNPAAIEAGGTPNHANPLDPEQITSVSYDIFSTPFALSSQFDDNSQYTVNPIGGENFQTPQNMVVSYVNTETYPDTYFIGNTEDIGIRGYADDPTYNQQGSWWGGDGNIVSEDPNKGITNTTGGGYGTPSKNSDDIGLPNDSQFNIDATNCGFVTIFNPTASQMLSFNQWLFASFKESWWDNLKKILQDPLDFVISAGVIKYKPTVKQANQEIKFNGIGTEVFANTVTQWKKIDLGSVSMTEQFKTYLDYSGYSDVKIFLPFCGIQSLDINDVQNSTLHLVYYIDNLTGSCIAHLNVNRADRGQTDDSHINSVLYKFTGNAMQTLPLTAKDYATMIGAVMNLATSTVAAVSTGGVGALGLANSVSNSADKLRPSIQRSGNLGSNYGMMDCLQPYLILERPIRSIPAEYGSYVGYPSASTIRIGACKGFTKGRPDTNWASNIHATDKEKEEIKELIEGGIYI